ncbi:microsomal signal peptidase 12 kDa subunit-domain-containing protein [Dissophora ornata]|nr:hypothetical protein BGZ58_010394 [Dissophora ornata]KAI8596178.1 microsomal signal peptidase 12 kDa subunit-domain-containing protein [Dissophora ornata]
MFEYHIDFQGQSLAEQITQGVISAFGVLGFLVGIVLQDIRVSFYIFVAGIVLTASLVIPAWPYLNKNPIKWLPSRAQAAAALLKQEASDSKEKSKST